MIHTVIEPIIILADLILQKHPSAPFYPPTKLYLYLQIKVFTYLLVFLSALLNFPFPVCVNFTVMLLSHSSLWPSYLAHDLSLMHVCLSAWAISYLLFFASPGPQLYSLVFPSVAYYSSSIKPHEMSPYVPQLVVTFPSFLLFLHCWFLSPPRTCSSLSSLQSVLCFVTQRLALNRIWPCQ